MIRSKILKKRQLPARFKFDHVEVRICVQYAAGQFSIELETNKIRDLSTVIKYFAPNFLVLP